MSSISTACSLTSFLYTLTFLTVSLLLQVVYISLLAFISYLISVRLSAYLLLFTTTLQQSSSSPVYKTLVSVNIN
jgi:hypothetical protein